MSSENNEIIIGSSTVPYRRIDGDNSDPTKELYVFALNRDGGLGVAIHGSDAEIKLYPYEMLDFAREFTRLALESMEK